VDADSHVGFPSALDEPLGFFFAFLPIGSLSLDVLEGLFFLLIGKQLFLPTAARCPRGPLFFIFSKPSRQGEFV